MIPFHDTETIWASVSLVPKSHERLYLWYHATIPNQHEHATVPQKHELLYSWYWNNMNDCIYDTMLWYQINMSIPSYHNNTSFCILDNKKTNMNDCIYLWYHAMIPNQHEHATIPQQHELFNATPPEELGVSFPRPRANNIPASRPPQHHTTSCYFYLVFLLSVSIIFILTLFFTIN